MLSAPIKSRRKRRRRKKQAVLSQSGSATPSGLIENSPPESDVPEQRLHPKLSEEFLREEAEIETVMLLKRFSKESDLSKRKERDIAFFTNNIDPEESNKENNDAEIEAIREESMDILPTPSSIRTSYPYPDEGQQLASSYFHDDDGTVIEPIQKQKIHFEDDLLFVPDFNVARATRDIESTGDEWRRNIADEGLFVYEKPVILNRNRNLMINRFIEENAMAWLTPDNTDIENMIRFITGSYLYKSNCIKKMRPVLYPPTSVEASSASYALQDKILKIQIQDIVFEGHPSFNAEQTIARKLELLYEEYAHRRQNNLVSEIQLKLDVIRKLLTSTAQSHTDSIQSRRTTTSGDEATYLSHKNELRDLRNRLHREEKTDRDIAQSLMKEWLALKETREKQGYSRTALKLVIKTHEVIVSEDEREWDYRFNLEFNEIFEEAMEFYRDERRKYKERTRKQNDISDFEPMQKVRRPDVEEIRQQLYDIYTNSVRPPGEQIVDFELEKRGGVADPQKQGADLTKYVIRLHLDDKEVSVVSTCKMDGNGHISLNELFSIKFVTKMPETIKLMIYEKQAFKSDNKIAELFPPIPLENEFFANASTYHMSFTSKATQHSGKIRLKCGWASAGESNPYTNSSQSLHKSNTAEPKMRNIVKRWYDEHLIDPMDPDNNSLLKYVHDGPEETETSPSAIQKNVFRLNEDLTAFCSRDKLDNDKRLNLLIARFNSDLKMKNCRLVPHTEVEIEIPDELKIFEDMLWVDPIDVQRYQGRKYLKHVYDIITNHCELINRDYDCHDLLVGDTPPTLLGVMEAISNIFSPRRPLHPKRRTTTNRRFVKFSTAAHIDRFNIILNVVRASGIPYRTGEEHQPILGRTSIGSAFQNIQRPVNVRPFISTTFKDKIMRTSTVEGSSPTWNEQIVISVHEDINEIKDALRIQLFDEIIEDLSSNDDPSAGNEIYQKVSNRYLGELVIPFSTIYTSQRIEGTFEMATPHILLGYTKPSVSLPDHNYLDGSGKLEIRQSILISLLISIEPIIHIVQFSTSNLECTELNRIRKYVKVWYEEIREEFPERCQNPIVSLANGKRVCITRLIGPIDIPFERGDASEYLIRRFVSLIPVRPHKNVCTKLNGIWLTNDQILNILITSPKDLGVLLTCYYLSLGYKAFLVLGYAIPYGDTTFVLTKENGDYFLIDPHSGKKYSSRDTFSPLTKVYCLANNDNVWANIQREHRVYMQNFDVGVSTEWRELFSKSLPAPNELVHNLELIYVDSLDCSNLRKSIETKLMKKISVWRGTRKTIWNKQLREPMLQILKNLEEDRCFEYDPKNYLEKLNNGYMSKFKFSGFPLNMPYINMARIVERLRGTGIHVQGDSNVEFALAVHIQPYPMNVFSVWIFILSMTPK